MDELRTYYTQWSKSERERQILHINTCVWNLERWYWWTCLQCHNGDTDIENRLEDTVWKVQGGGWNEGVAWKHIHFLKCTFYSTLGPLTKSMCMTHLYPFYRFWNNFIVLNYYRSLQLYISFYYLLLVLSTIYLWCP